MQLNLFTSSRRAQLCTHSPSVTVAPFRLADRRRWQQWHGQDIAFSGVGEAGLLNGVAIARSMSNALQMPMVVLAVEDGGKQRMELFRPHSQISHRCETETAAPQYNQN